MTPYLLLFLFLLLPQVFAQCPDILTLTDKVINGNPSIPTYQISLSSPPTPSIRRCTASRIAPSWAITAAHCNVNTSWTATIAGNTVFSGQEARVIQVHIHPSYQQPTHRRFDIALIQLSTSESSLPDEATVTLNDHSAIPFPDAFVRVAGYGAIDTSLTPTFGNLTHVDIPTVAFDQCQRLYRGTPNLGKLDSRRQMCAGYPQGGCDACSGDSGGPVVQFDAKGRAVQVALISASRGCALPGFPGIGVRIDAFLPWIRSFDVQFTTGRGLQVLKESGGRIVTKDPPSDDTDVSIVNDVPESPAPSVSQSPAPQPSPNAPNTNPVVVITPTPPRPPRPDQGVENRLPSPSPSQSRVPKPVKPGKDEEQGVGKPIGPRIPPIKPTPTTPKDEQTLDGIDIEEDDQVATSAEPDEPDEQTGALAGDAAIGPDISGGTPVGAIAGGVVGGLVLVALVISAFVFVTKNQGDNGQTTDSDNTAEDQDAQA